MPSSQDPLSRTLAGWRLQPSRNPQFRTEVWTRIGAASRPSNWARFARAHPAAVAGIVALGAAVGALSGRTEARQRFEADRSAIAASYVHGLDARWMRQP